MIITARVISLLIGYFCGCVLTAEIVARRYAGTSASKLGDTGNPGMANIMASLGFKPGIITLAGDIGKCIVAAIVSYACFHEAGNIVCLYAGLGCTIGHDFPFWRNFRGGKGVATTSIAIALFSFPLGILANIAGMLVVFVTKYLCIGGPVIPLAFAVFMFVQGKTEAGLISLLLTLLSIRAHLSAMQGIRTGRTKKVDVIAAIKKKFFHS